MKAQELDQGVVAHFNSAIFGAHEMDAIHINALVQGLVLHPTGITHNYHVSVFSARYTF